MINNGKDFILIDIETTGFSAYEHEITEIGALKVDGKTLKVKEQFQSLVRIRGHVPARIVELTGITKEMTERYGRRIDDVLDELSKFCKDLNCFAHNCSFDKSFIRVNLDRHGIDYKETQWIDTIQIFKDKFPGRSTYKLASLIEDYKIADKENHRAVDDAMMTLELLKL